MTNTDDASQGGTMLEVQRDTKSPRRSPCRPGGPALARLPLIIRDLFGRFPEFALCT
jgi:hypothetical protein